MKIFEIGQIFYLPQLHIRRNKSGELWSSNLGDLNVKSYPPKAPFLEDHILAPKGCWAPKFLHAPENDKVLLSHPHKGWGFHLQFFSKGVKNWLKIQCISLKIFGARGCGLTKLCHMMCRYMGVTTSIQLLGGISPLKFGRAKIVQN